MTDLTTIELKALLPSKDFELSKQFFQELGFAVHELGSDPAHMNCGPANSH